LFNLTALPNEGYDGKVPTFPLPQLRRYRWEFEDKKKYQVFDEELSDLFRKRERAVWRDIWRTPQACAWSNESWRWPIIGEYCRLKTVIEQEPDSNAALVGQLHRYRDQIGLTPAGMRDNGWAIAPDEVAQKSADREDEPGSDDPEPERRLSSVPDAQ
jgi:hypothetical protein